MFRNKFIAFYRRFKRLNIDLRYRRYFHKDHFHRFLTTIPGYFRYRRRRYIHSRYFFDYSRYRKTRKKKYKKRSKFFSIINSVRRNTFYNKFFRLMRKTHFSTLYSYFSVNNYNNSVNKLILHSKMRTLLS